MRSEELYLYMIMKYEEKLQSLMSAEDYYKFSKEMAKDVFRVTLERMPDSDIKDFALNHFDEITEDENA